MFWWPTDHSFKRYNVSTKKHNTDFDAHKTVVHLPWALLAFESTEKGGNCSAD